MSASLAIAAIAALSGSAFAADPVTKDEAMAMVKEAVAAIKSEGPEKAYAEITIRRASSSTAIFTSWSMASTAWFSRMAPTNRASAPTRSSTRIRRQGLRQRARRPRQAKSKLLAVLQIHEPGHQEGRAEADVLRAA
jgi:hypothetical protein